MIYLESLTIIKDQQTLEHWALNDLILSPEINLIAGKNAVGKTKTLQEISAIADLISKKKDGIDFKENFKLKATFKKEEEAIKYEYSINGNDGKDIEKLEVFNNNDHGNLLVDRLLEENKLTHCKVFNVLNNEFEDFFPPNKTLAVHLRDVKKHPYLEDLFSWAENVLYIDFKSIKNDVFSTIYNAPGFANISEGRFENLFHEIEHNSSLQESIRGDFNAIGYDIRQITYSSEHQPYHLIKFQETSGNLNITYDLLSSGMKSAFSIIALINYYLHKEAPLTLLIDDLGEGLDYERASKLTKLLAEKLKNSNITLVVSSNECYLMDYVDFKSWNILQRKGSIVKAYNYANSKDTFDDLEFSGLSNFDNFTDFVEALDSQDA